MVVHNFNKYILNNSPSGNLFVARFTDANFSFCQQQGGGKLKISNVSSAGYICRYIAIPIDQTVHPLLIFSTRALKLV